MTLNMKKIASAFFNKEEVAFISHSVTPEMDSVSQLNAYAQAKGIDKFERWHLVTGSEADIFSIARKSYFVEEEIGLNKAQEFLHTEKFILIDKDGHIRGVYNGTLALEAERLIEDIQLLLEE